MRENSSNKFANLFAQRRQTSASADDLIGFAFRWNRKIKIRFVEKP